MSGKQLWVTGTVINAAAARLIGSDVPAPVESIGLERIGRMVEQVGAVGQYPGTGAE